MTRPRKLRRRCPVTDKGCYRDQAAAIWGGQLVNRINAQHGNPMPQLYVYACRVEGCPWWHLTRSPGRRDNGSNLNDAVPMPDVTQATATAERLRRERSAMRANELDDSAQLRARLRP